VESLRLLATVTVEVNSLRKLKQLVLVLLISECNNFPVHFFVSFSNHRDFPSIVARNVLPSVEKLREWFGLAATGDFVSAMYNKEEHGIVRILADLNENGEALFQGLNNKFCAIDLKSGAKRTTTNSKGFEITAMIIRAMKLTYSRLLAPNPDLEKVFPMFGSSSFLLTSSSSTDSTMSGGSFNSPKSSIPRTYYVSATTGKPVPIESTVSTSQSDSPSSIKIPETIRHSVPRTYLVSRPLSATSTSKSAMILFFSGSSSLNKRQSDRRGSSPNSSESTWRLNFPFQEPVQ
jgi:hypothetical protein